LELAVNAFSGYRAAWCFLHHTVAFRMKRSGVKGGAGAAGVHRARHISHPLLLHRSLNNKHERKIFFSQKQSFDDIL
jgi:hypothetical protein